MYIFNKSGPRIEPWGTPNSNFFQEIKAVPILTRCHLSVK